MGYNERCEVTELKGRTIKKLEQLGESELRFEMLDGGKYLMHHSQYCCESVSIEDVTGDLKDLIGHPLLTAEMRTSDERPDDIKDERYKDSETWTFYEFATIRGSVTIRWYGASNGYYSEEVSFERVKEDVEDDEGYF